MEGPESSPVQGVRPSERGGLAGTVVSTESYTSPNTEVLSTSQGSHIRTNAMSSGLAGVVQESHICQSVSVVHVATSLKNLRKPRQRQWQPDHWRQLILNQSSELVLNKTYRQNRLLLRINCKSEPKSNENWTCQQTKEIFKEYYKVT